MAGGFNNKTQDEKLANVYKELEARFPWYYDRKNFWNKMKNM